MSVKHFQVKLIFNDSVTGIGAVFRPKEGTANDCETFSGAVTPSQAANPHPMLKGHLCPLPDRRHLGPESPRCPEDNPKSFFHSRDLVKLPPCLSTEASVSLPHQAMEA